ncbi:MAG: ABC-type multidrug transport system, ATPase and permease component [Bacteroidetes bacterium]|nr:ABC-type multidrug transport system, ATPase and permease component [Bacteroidota bacterium]
MYGFKLWRKINGYFRVAKIYSWQLINGFRAKFLNIILGSLKHINKYFFKYRWRLGLGILFVSISNAFGVFSVTYIGGAIDYVNSFLKNPGVVSDPYDELFVFGLKIIGMALLSGFFLYLTRQTIIVMSRLIEYDLKNEIYDHYQRLDIAFYKRNNTGDLMNRITEDVSRVRMYIGPAIMYIVNTFITFILCIIVMIDTDVKLTAYVLLPLPLLAITIYFVSDTINKKSTKVQEKLSDITTMAQEAFSGIRVLKAYGREQQSFEEFDKKTTEYKRRTLGLVKTESLFQPFMILLIGLSTIFTIYIGGMEVIAGKITFGSIAVFIVFVNKLTWPIASLGWVTSLIQRAAASQTRINEFLRTSPEIRNDHMAPSAILGKIEFKNVSFTYPDSGIQALNNVSFGIEPGKTLAIVGKTGSGKSTVASLICRLYDPTAGEILIDKKRLANLNLADLRQQTGYVPQEVFLFSDTISNNIAFGVNADKHTIPAIENAARNAAIYSNIIEFPEKFETIVGERGITLSGGQKQRVSIARAIIKDPQILIFDDCLSAVDTETEEEILTNLKSLMKNKTSIIISHRVSSVKSADTIIVLDDGQIIEQGNHQELLEIKGTYYNLHLMQLLEAEKQGSKADHKL